MTTTVDERVMRAPASLCFALAADVESWPALLPHYRLVRFHGSHGFGTGRVEMSAWRELAGPLRYPTWWVSDMHVVADEPAIHFVHVDGITRGMQVKWAFLPASHPEHTRVRITHAWAGPSWPVIGVLAWRHVIGPHFVSYIAARTLAGIAAEAERRQGS
jgi:ribosome-associated toxin RatA of RatAB toxin-antitoxin module